ncbi:MAG TPA: hypothetical protein VIL20_30340 [Sandaracinaceae bacterium]
MTVSHAAIGMVLGALGSLAHLWITRARAGLVVRGRPGVAWALQPLGFAALAAFFVAAAKVAPLAAWCFVIGVFGARAIVLARARRAA